MRVPISGPMISIIIPVLNDASRLHKTLRSLAPYQNEIEVIVVDGGSIDDTLDTIKPFSWVTLLHDQPGRAIQMNTGATAAGGEICSFFMPIRA